MAFVRVCVVHVVCVVCVVHVVCVVCRSARAADWRAISYYRNEEIEEECSLMLSAEPSCISKPGSKAKAWSSDVLSFCETRSQIQKPFRSQTRSEAADISTCQGTA